MLMLGGSVEEQGVSATTTKFAISLVRGQDSAAPMATHASQWGATSGCGPAKWIYRTNLLVSSITHIWEPTRQPGDQDMN